MIKSRIYERDTDALFLRNFTENKSFLTAFVKAVTSDVTAELIKIETQTRHRTHSGSIDLELTFKNGTQMLIENKIDAGYSVTRAGETQPDRYIASVNALRLDGVEAMSVLLAPQSYLSNSRHASAFDSAVAYETLVGCLAGSDRGLILSAITQAEMPYEPVANFPSGSFFQKYKVFAGQYFPELQIKHNPNGNDVRPTESRTIYFDVAHTLELQNGIPKPRMSLQCRDSNAPSASVKIMIGKWGRLSDLFDRSTSLQKIGGYLRPAGQSLGIVMDTPRLDTQIPFDLQIAEVEEGLEATYQLRRWWNSNSKTLRDWADQVSQMICCK